MPGKTARTTARLSGDAGLTPDAVHDAESMPVQAATSATRTPGWWDMAHARRIAQGQHASPPARRAKPGRRRARGLGAPTDPTPAPAGPPRRASPRCTCPTRAAPALRDVAVGHVALAFANPSGTLPLIRRDVGRSPLAPEIPTFDEAGIPGAVTWAWFGLAARRETPATILDSLNAALNRTLSDPATASRLVALGIPPRVMGRDAFGEFLARAFEEDAALIRAAGVRIE
ncbi:tripartite tricarboxylate transporter substrate-binding protein [Roseomonas sp. CCTCC AB2023176]|uniref:tripartite tricarboxylate transporter substrate-binding protein n=1 Tax=Roseomonas sp. CCTCC AB2023176 TaxID=3342640 RepID=UPI0035E2AEE0